MLAEHTVTQKSTYHNDNTNVLGKNREKDKMVRYLNTRIANEIPYRLAPYTQDTIDDLLDAQAIKSQ